MSLAMRRYQLFVAGSLHGEYDLATDADAKHELRLMAVGLVGTAGRRLSCTIRDGERVVSRFDVGRAEDLDD